MQMSQNPIRFFTVPIKASTSATLRSIFVAKDYYMSRLLTLQPASSTVRKLQSNNPIHNLCLAQMGCIAIPSRILQQCHDATLMTSTCPNIGRDQSEEPTPLCIALFA